MFAWTRLLGFKTKRVRIDAQTVCLVLITADDQYGAEIAGAGSSFGWEVHRARTVSEGIEMIRSLAAPLAIFDAGETALEWQAGLGRISSESKQSCVLLASRVVDENLRQEVMRHRGFDILPKLADREQVARAIEFAWFWITRSRNLIERVTEERR